MLMFEEKTPGIMSQLRQDFLLTDLEAAAILGNLGHDFGSSDDPEHIEPAECVDRKDALSSWNVGLAWVIVSDVHC